MKKCASCSGFVPNAKTECPNCGARLAGSGLSPRMKTLGAFGAILGGGAFAMTLMACYGCPPSDKQCMGFDEDGGRSLSDPTIGSDAGRDARAANDASNGNDASDASDASASADGSAADGASDDGSSADAGDDAADGM
jgi:hypothetical protein